MSKAAIIYHDLQNELSIDLGHIAYRADGRVLDLGAGTGRVALMLAGRGHNVVAVDWDAELLHELDRRRRRQLNGNGRHGRIITFACDAMELPALLGEFDTIVLSNGFLEIIGPRNRQRVLLRRLRKHLAPHGRMLVDTCDVAHVHDFTPADDYDAANGLLVRRTTLLGIFTEGETGCDEDAYEYIWRRQVRLRGIPLWRTLEPVWQTLWPSRLEDDAPASGLRVSERIHAHVDEWTSDLIMYELVHG